MSETFNNFLCDLMIPSTTHDINWDIDHEPKNKQLYLAAIPGSEVTKPLENEAVHDHIKKLHRALLNYG